MSVGATSGSQECLPNKHRGGSEEPLIAWIQLTGQPPGHVLSMTSPNRHPRVKVRVLVTQPCPALRNPMDCSPPGSSVHDILQSRILEWVTIPVSRRSSQPRDRTWVSCIAGRFFTTWATREAPQLGCRECKYSTLQDNTKLLFRVTLMFYIRTIVHIIY